MSDKARRGAGGAATAGKPASLEQARTEIAARLRERRAEIEQAVMVRASALLEGTESLDPQFFDGQRTAVIAAVDYGIVSIELGAERAPAVPAIFHSHARLTARSGVSLDTMLRRYFAGYTLLGDFLVREAEECRVQGSVLQCVMSGMSTVFERLLTTMTEEYSREAEGGLNSSEERFAARVRRLLDGELVDTGEFDYEFDAWHIGVLAVGAEAPAAIRALAGMLDRRLLLVCSGERPVWAWLGGRRKVAAPDLERMLGSTWPGEVSLAIGEPAEGLSGWRLTHEQARAVLPVALRSSDSYVRYADAALLASMLQDDLLATSLRELYLMPLEGERDGGEVLRRTLRAYFDADRNASSAAAALGVSRHTVTNRLRLVEERIGKRLSAAGGELEAALRLDDLNVSTPPADIFAPSE
jgi:PucR C-terminal helix-turn-helix domain/GGDEF-like domain